ncbi:MAG: helix-turn-helix domain-containing protein [Nanoarchaeota archaeon]|nr:helix-turn-helix domain-containing protein [Nanoarchaeota archaeon]
MVNEKFMLVSLDDERAKSLAEVLGNKTCKKIIEHLAENKDASEKDLSVSLKIPLNTIEYNLKKLLKSGFVEKKKNFFWSKKGKKILMYELTNRSIVISPKKSLGDKVKSILPSLILLFSGTFAIWAYQRIQIQTQRSAEYFASPSEATSNLMEAGMQNLDQVFNYSPDPIWLWFFSGGLIAILIFSIVNWRKL